MDSESLWEYAKLSALIGSMIKSCFGISAIYGIYSFIKNYTYKTVNLSVGSFKVRRKHHNVQTLTNIVSANFYGGGTIPDDVRREILFITSPKVKKMAKND